MKRYCRVALVATVLSVVCSNSLMAQGRVRVGEVHAFEAQTPHPYPPGLQHRPSVWQDQVVSPDATFVRVHFVNFDLAPGDFVTVSSPDGLQSWTYRNRGPHGSGAFWAFAVRGDTAVVTLHAGETPGYGYRINRVGRGTAPIQEVVCGTDDRESIACTSEDVSAVEDTVAKLLFVSGAFQFLCTGWLVEGANDHTLMTNNHCISTQSETDSLQASFNFQEASCGGDLATSSSFAGGTLLKTNNVDRRGRREGLDYTLLTLQGGPQGIVPLVPDPNPTTVGVPIWLIQHPGGRPKEIAVCSVDETEQTYGRTATGSQMGYSCDTEGGSSGSPVIETGTRNAIGLHHFGNVSSSECLNGATMMSAICADAGSLLSCGSGDPDDPDDPGSGKEKCRNGVDDDGDGLIDCADSDCASKRFCNNEDALRDFLDLFR